MKWKQRRNPKNKHWALETNTNALSANLFTYVWAFTNKKDPYIQT